MVLDNLTPPVSVKGYEYTGFHGYDSVCDITAWPKKNLVIASHVENGNTSPMLRAEHLAQVVSSEQGIKPKKLVWVNHVPPACSTNGEESFSLVVFTIDKDRQGSTVFKDADFKHIRKEVLEAYLEDIVVFKPKHKFSLRYYMPW